MFDIIVAVPASLNLNLSLSITVTLYATDVDKPDMTVSLQRYSNTSPLLKLWFFAYM